MAARKPPPPALPRVRTEDIRLLVGARSFEGARTYFRDDRVHDLRVQGRTLRGRCDGSADHPYEVTVRFDATGVTETACTCPMASYCKHVGALLLAWSYEESDASTAEALDEVLAKRPREELIAIIERMVALHPELDALVQTPAARGGHAASTDWPAVVALAMRGANRDWRAAKAAIDALTRIVAQAETMPPAHTHDAVEACRAVITAASDAHRERLAPEDEMLGPLFDAVRVLRARLATMKARDADRAATVDTLLDVTLTDILEGRAGPGDEARDALDECATATERAQIVERVRAEVPGASTWARGWLGAWLLTLEGEGFDDAQYLAHCREFGLQRLLIERLVDRRRVTDALHEMERFDDRALLEAAAVLATRHGDDAERLVRARYQQKPDRSLRAWLHARLTARGDTAGLLDLALDAFREHPSVDAYRDVRALATKTDRWPALRDELRAALAPQRAAMIRVLLDEGDHDAALAALDAMKSPPKSSSWGHASPGSVLELDVARAIAATHPARAQEIFCRRAESLLSLRDRSAYRQCCELLVCARPLMGDEAWRAHVAGLRARHPTLRALHEELARIAGSPRRAP